jgi:hypothetical protein
MTQTITGQQFKVQFGIDPEKDDLERVNCTTIGTVGHQQCGVCEIHKKPRFMCGCLAQVPEISQVHFWKNRREAIGTANRMTSDSEEQHQAIHVPTKGWLVKNVVKGTYTDSFLWSIPSKIVEEATLTPGQQKLLNSIKEAIDGDLRRHAGVQRKELATAKALERKGLIILHVISTASKDYYEAELVG